MKIHKYYEKKTGKEKEAILLSRTEQETEYERSMQMVLDNTRWVLDNLEHLDEFKVGWKNYGRPRLREGKTRN